MCYISIITTSHVCLQQTVVNQVRKEIYHLVIRKGAAQEGERTKEKPNRTTIANKIILSKVDTTSFVKTLDVRIQEVIDP